MKTSCLIIISILICLNGSIYAQDPNSSLLFQYFGANENQMEIEYISMVLDDQNLSFPGVERDRKIIETHNYYLAHKEEIDMKIKADELVWFRNIAKEEINASWAKAITSFISQLPAAIEAGQNQQEEYQKKRDKDRDIQQYIAQHSSSTPKQYSQNFGSASSETNVMRSPKVTTSNGYDEPLNTQGLNNSNNGGLNGIETVGMMVSNGAQQNVRIRVSGNSIIGIYVGGNIQSPLGDGWSQTNLQGAPTSIQLDGEWSKMYKNRATSRDIDNAIIYF